MAKTWANFWAQQSDPRHPRDADFYAIHSAELQLIVGSCAGKRVLELGCGSGELFDHLHFGEATTYRGVDFSQQMLAKFAERHPEVITAYGDASTYRDEECYDIIFSNAVVQYLSREMLARLIANGRAMMTPTSRLVLGSVPWKPARSAFYLNAFYPHMGRTPRNWAVLMRAWVGIDRIGHWYRCGTLSKLARINGLSIRFYGSLQFPYCFHAKFELLP